MRTFLLGSMAVALAMACSPGSGGGGDAGEGGSSSGGSSSGSSGGMDAGEGGGSGGSSSGSGGSSSGSGMCSGTPQSPIVGSCVFHGANMVVLTCVDYTGPDYTLSSIMAGCLNNDASASPCPSTNIVGGACIVNCGQGNESVAHYYSASKATPADVQAACAKEMGFYVQ